MAFPVMLYKFAKPVNSTAIPASTTQNTTASCISNDTIDILYPVLKLKMGAGASGNPTGYNYAYIQSFGRYYWVNNWVCTGGLWEAHLSVDALASWRAEIGNSTQYVSRSSATFNGKIIDNLYPCISNPTKAENIWETPWKGVNDKTKGCYVIGIAGQEGVTHLVFLESGMKVFFEYLLSDAYGVAAIGALDLALYPEAKIALNPLQYITSVRYYPIMLVTNASERVETIKVGYADIPVAAWNLPTDSGLIWGTILGTLQKHPDAQTRGEYLNAQPYTDYRLYFPPFGIFSLDGNLIGDLDKLLIYYIIDGKTGICRLEVQAAHGTGENSIDTESTVMLFNSSAQVGIDIQISQILSPGYGGMQLISNIVGGVAGVTAGVVTGNYVGAASAGLGAVFSTMGNAVNGKIPQISSVGSVGSAALLTGNIIISYTFYRQTPEDNANKGRPICNNFRLSTIPGYQLIPNCEIEIAGATATELTQIKQNLESGYYYA